MVPRFLYIQLTICGQRSGTWRPQRLAKTPLQYAPDTTIAPAPPEQPEERERAVQAAATDAQHAELVEKIGQLTVLRESNATLRAEVPTYYG